MRHFKICHLNTFAQDRSFTRLSDLKVKSSSLDAVSSAIGHELRL